MVVKVPDHPVKVDSLRINNFFFEGRGGLHLVMLRNHLVLGIELGSIKCKVRALIPASSLQI